MSVLAEIKLEIEKLQNDHVAYKGRVMQDLETRFNEFMTFKETSEKLLEEEQRQFDETLLRLNTERDRLALAEKLLGFPVELVEKHQVCGVCGEAMRPYHVSDGKKYWACQNGNLAPAHDLIVVA